VRQIKIIINKLLKSESQRSILKLVSGTGLAQLIGIAATPIITRLYAPEVFGISGLFISSVSLLTIAAAGKYDLALMLPKSHKKSSQLLALCLLLILISSVIITVGVLVYMTFIVFQGNNVQKWMFLIPIGVILNSLFECFSAWLNRFKLYNELSYAAIIRRLSIVSAQVLLAIFIGTNFWCLLGGVLFGSFIAVLFLLKIAFKKEINFSNIWNCSSVKKVGKQYSMFPKYLTLSTWFNTLSMEMAVFFFSFYFEQKYVGYYVLSKQVLYIPMSIIGTSIQQVFFQKACEIRDDKVALLNLFFKTIKHLFVIGFIPMLIILIFGKHLFVLIFGKNWEMAGIMSQILSPWLLLAFCLAPVSQAITIVDQNKAALLLQVAILIIRAVTLTISCVLFKNILIIILIFSVINCCIVLGNMVIQSQLILRSDG
jgi:O-antigen/teichoic acid export membrane protein